MSTYLLVVYGFSLAYGMLILFFLWSWMRLPEFIPSGLKPVHKVSIVIPARNESVHLELLLNDLADQQYPRELHGSNCGGRFLIRTTRPPLPENFLRLPVKVLSLAEHLDPSCTTHCA
jgi:cellulose synthase/poly-beta-1,6-N-acetylglucosamine synthase-like glycosyltransferase